MSLLRIWVLTKRELKSFFYSPVFYVSGGLFSVLIGWLFFNYIVLSKEMTSQTLTQVVLAPMFGNINFIFLFLTPLMTMRLFAEEKKNKTLDLLYSSPLTHGEIISGKFISSFIACALILALSLILPVTLFFSGYSDWGVVFTSYLGCLMTIACYISIGLFASSLTENQIVSALTSFCLSFILMLFILTANAVNNPLVGEIFQYFSVSFHYEGFVRGVIKSFNLVYYGTFIFFLLHLTNQSLDSRNW